MDIVNALAKLLETAYKFMSINYKILGELKS